VNIQPSLSVGLRAWSVLVIAVKRILSQPGLALASLLGLVISTALTMSIPLYADAIYHRLFRADLAAPAGARQRPPLAFLFLYEGALRGGLQWEALQPIDQYLSQQAGPALGLPLEFIGRYVSTDSFTLFPRAGTSYTAQKPLASVGFAFLSDVESHITLLEGKFPAVAPAAAASTVDVLISEASADKLGLQVGETCVVFIREKTASGVQTNTEIPVRIAGIWRPKAPQESFWFFDPVLLDTQLLVPEGTFVRRISPYLASEVGTAMWYLAMRDTDIRTDGTAALIGRIGVVQQQAANLLPVKLVESPLSVLTTYQRNAAVLTIMLYAFSIPILGLLFVFIALTSGLVVEQQRNEVAVLRSRGTPVIQMLGITLLESLLLGAIALGLSLPFSLAIAALIGQARSFLSFSSPSDLRVSLTATAVEFGAAAIVAAVVAQMLPTLSAARHTIVTYKQERSRALRRPWWQRAWLDVLLLIPAAYGAYLLRGQGSLASLNKGNPFENPFLFLVPALATFALTLFFLRLLPACMAGIAWLAERSPSVGLLMAARHLARSPGLYTAPMLLLALTLSLSVFTASVADTLDHHLSAQMNYKVGADLKFLDLRKSAAQSDTGQDTAPSWLFVPVSEYLKLPGVLAATRVGNYLAFSNLNGESQRGAFLGIDREAFPKVAFWRQDFAPASLGALMNELARVPNGVLAPRGLLSAYGLKVGDPLRLLVYTSGRGSVALNLEIVGGFDIFPTWYPSAGALYVGNLDYLFDQAGGQFPYEVWLKTTPGVDQDQLVKHSVGDIGIGDFERAAALPLIEAEQRRPERQGLFGLLSVGFAAVAALTALGFLLYALFSFRRRFVELGVLRAIGLSQGQMISFLAWELAFFLAMGGGLGTGLGIGVSRLFIPYLQVGSDPMALIPPYVVEISWQAIARLYVLFGLLFVVALLALVALLRRMQIFQAIKLGETV
jgi:putative ABC transport system permease protein